MKLRDFASQVRIDPNKLTKYALNKDHPKGRHKAIVFEAALGFTSVYYQPLIEQIREQALEAEAAIKQTDQFGHHLRVDIIISGVENQVASVRIGWLVPPDSKTASLTTLYVVGELEHD